VFSTGISSNYHKKLVFNALSEPVGRGAQFTSNEDTTHKRRGGPPFLCPFFSPFPTPTLIASTEIILSHPLSLVPTINTPMRPSLTLLALTLAAGVGATSPMSGGNDTPALPHTPATNPAPGFWQRWFAFPTSHTPNNLSHTTRRVRTHGARRRSVHP
jgi:hypothetical protein